MESPEREPDRESASQQAPDLDREESTVAATATPEVVAVTREYPQEPSPAHLPGRWRLLRDAAAFQVKLVIDGMRDVMLSPLSLVAAIAGLALGRHEWFYQLLHLGRSSERWIDLFSAAKRVGEPQMAAAQRQRERERERPGPVSAVPRTPDTAEPARPPSPEVRQGPRTWYSDSRWSSSTEDPNQADSIDDLIAALESRLQEQYQRGGVTARAKHTIDRMLDAVEERYREGRRNPPPNS